MHRLISGKFIGKKFGHFFRSNEEISDQNLSYALANIKFW